MLINKGLKMMFIKKAVQLSVIVSVVAGLVACADARNYSTAVNSWHGAPERALLQHWGSPAETKRLSNGNHLLVYRVVDHQRYPKVYSPGINVSRLSPQNNNTVVLSKPPLVPRPHDETFWCETSFGGDKADMIVNSRYEGNNCITTQEGAKRRSFSR